jgi:hypothetical protein
MKKPKYERVVVTAKSEIFWEVVPKTIPTIGSQIVFSQN